MKKLYTICAVLLVACLVYAEQSELTGNDYLSFSKRKRVRVVNSYIMDAKRDGGVIIRKDPISYCRKLDSFYAKSPNMTSEPLPVILRKLIIMEYDWQQKGVDKDKLAQETLGDEVYKANKKRLGMK